ncbi:pseudouridine synthase A [Seminavis robusta]|uniref:tRNA pseudouridine synthase n=1 Tax=Seminavis robusta TaxID=568900 RepID=A0A9N8EUB5_9STRA|nr:pseudouridine synthase A [Seminavis robusta]|eukprot:Sro1841_g300980.1 pseudouridine synthase A (356) ;mRNA; r:9324-10391
MPRQYILIISYDGTRFHGFQRQYANVSTNTSNNSSNKVVGVMKKRPRVDTVTGVRPPLVFNHKTVTVQECLESAILHWIGNSSPLLWTLEKLNLRVAGRTDKGVHARGQVVAVQLPEEALVPPKDNNNQQALLEPWQIQRAIHGRLPIDISIQRVIPVDGPELFDPRHSAKSKQYSYTLKYQRAASNNTEVAVGAQTFRTALDDAAPCVWLCPFVLQDDKLRAACQALLGTHDYSVFVHKEARRDKDNTLTITRFDMEILKEYAPPSLYLINDSNNNNNNNNKPYADIVLAKFYVEGERFRRTMVRNLIGFLVEVGRGAQTLDDMDQTIWTGSDQVADLIPVAPASGLCLEFVKF